MTKEENIKTTQKAIIYCRVSTEEQGKSGFSLPQQLGAVREYCEDNGIEVVGTYEEEFSSDSLDRPVLDVVRDIVAEGGIDLVVSQDRDRFSRNRFYRVLLQLEFEENGTKIRALDDSGDDSPMGRLHDGMRDLFAEYELERTRERTRRGKLQKAKSGQIVGTGTPPYGFRYRDGHYYIDTDRIRFVHIIFEKAASGSSLYSIAQHLTKMGAPTPRCGRWHASTIRQIIKSDTYAGTFYWNKNRVTTKHVSEKQNGSKIYKRRVKTEERPRSEWIGVPVPDSGIPHETIARAKENLNGNIRSVSRSKDRTWELSGGIGLCAECGRHMVAHTTTNSSKRSYYYYKCSGRGYNACSNRKNYPAADLEARINDAIVQTFEPETWEGFVNDLCDIKLANIRNLYRSDPRQIKENLAKRIGTLETKISRARELFIDGDLPRPDYEEKKNALRDEITLLQEEMSTLNDLDNEVRRVEDLRRTLKGLENPLNGHYALTEFPEDHDVFEMYNFGYGSRETAARRRQDFYIKTGLTARVGEEKLEINLGMDRNFVSSSGSASANSSGSTSF